MSNDNFIHLQVQNSKDLRGINGNAGVLVQVPKPIFPADGYNIYAWDANSTDADDVPTDGGVPIDDAPGGTWASTVNPTGNVGDGRWKLWGDRISSLPLNPDWNALSGPSMILNKPAI